MTKTDQEKPIIPTEEQPKESSLPETPPEQNPQPGKEEMWKKVDAVFNAAKASFLEKNVSFADVIDSLVATLMDIMATETHSLGGLGTEKPKVNLVEEENQGEIPE